MKKLIIPIVFLLFIGTAYSQWVSNYCGDPSGDVNFASAKGNAVTSDNSGNCYVTGFSFENGNGNDIVTIKYNPDGDTLWARTFNGTANSNDEGYGICVDSYGNVYVVGAAQNTNKGYDLTILKYDSVGVLLWSKAFDNGANGSCLEDKGLDIAVDNNGYIYVTGYSTNGSDYKEIATSKYSPDGTQMWGILEDGNDNLNSQGLSIAVGASGNIYVAGYVSTDSNGTDMAVIKYDSSGAKLWMNTYNGTGNGEDKAWGIVVDELDNAYVTGYATGDSSYIDCATLKYSSGGNLEWAKLYNREGNSTDKAWGIVVDTDGSIYITGETSVDSLNTNYLTIKYDNSGDVQWVKFYDGTGNASDIASAIGILADSNSRSIVVTGKSWGTNNNYDYATVRYSSTTGVQTQVNRYSMSGITDDVAKKIAISETRVFVTGYSELIVESSSNVSYISTQMMKWGESSELTNNNNTPQKYVLHQNYPNPFNPSTNIKFDISKASIVKLAIYDMLGREVAVLVNQQLTAGSYNIAYSNKDLSSGIYFYRLTAGNFVETKKMSLIK